MLQIPIIESSDSEQDSDVELIENCQNESQSILNLTPPVTPERANIVKPCQSSEKIYLGGTIYVEFFFKTANTIKVHFDKVFDEELAVMNSIEELTEDDEQEQCWTFDIQHYAKVERILSQNIRKVKLIPIPRFVMNAFRVNLIPTENILLSDHINATLFDKLEDYQKEDVLFGIARSGRLLIADEVGLDKTLPAIALAEYYIEDWPLLIVTTGESRDLWEELIVNYLPKVKPHEIFCLKTANDDINFNAKIILTSYTMLKKRVEELENRGRFGVVILDESHSIKNYKAQQTKAAQQICYDSKRVILLSDTPMKGYTKELHKQLSFLDENLENHKEFSVRYCNARQTEYGWYNRGSSHEGELRLLLRHAFLIRHSNEEGLTHKVRDRVRLTVEFENEDDKFDIREFIRSYKRTGKFDGSHMFFRTYAKSAKVKADAVFSYLDNYFTDNENKTVIVAYHKCMIEAIEELLDEKEIDYIKIDGSVSADERPYLIDNFQNENGPQVAILSIKLFSMAYKMTEAKKLFFAELFFNPSDFWKAENRLHQFGQLHNIEITYLVADDTVDFVLWNMMIKKQNILKRVGLTNEELGDIHDVFEPEWNDEDLIPLATLFNVTPRKVNSNFQ